MKTREQVLDTLFNFTDTQKQKIDIIAAEFIAIKDKKISIETYNTLTNCLREIDLFREAIIIRLLNSMKRGDYLG